MSHKDNQRKHLAEPFRLMMLIPVPWVFILVYFMGVGLEILFPFGPRSSDMVLVSKIGGAVLFLLGGALAAWGLIVFRKARTTTIPGETSTKLVTSGPYRFSRNPMYVGLSLAYIGEAGLLTQIWPLLMLPFVVAYVNWIVIPVEEARLKEDFGNAYEPYCARVRRWV